MRFIISFFFISLIAFGAFAEPVCSENNGNSALIIIDMQPHFVTRNGAHQEPENVKKVSNIIKEQIAAIERAKKARIPIVFIEYSGLGETNSELKSAIGNYNEVKVFQKSSDGMFASYNQHRSELAGYLTQKQIGTLIITGANGGACVQSSITGALDANCNVVAVSSGIADFNYREFIYPYTGQYASIKPNCQNCTFREVANIDAIEKYMVNNSVKPESVQVTGSKKARTRTKAKHQ